MNGNLRSKGGCRNRRVVSTNCEVGKTCIAREREEADCSEKSSSNSLLWQLAEVIALFLTLF